MASLRSISQPLGQKGQSGFYSLLLKCIPGSPGYRAAFLPSALPWVKVPSHHGGWGRGFAQLFNHCATASRSCCPRCCPVGTCHPRNWLNQLSQALKQQWGCGSIPNQGHQPARPPPCPIPAPELRARSEASLCSQPDPPHKSPSPTLKA